MKKILSGILCLGMIICLCGCEKTVFAPVSSVTEPSGNVVTSTSAEKTDVTADEKIKTEIPEVTDYAYSPTFNSILCIDGSGEIVDEVSTSPDEGDVICISNGIAYLRKFDSVAYNEGRESYVLKAMDLKTGSVEEIFRSNVMNGIDVYNGLIYINSDGGFVNGGEKVVLDEKTYEKVEGATIELAPVDGGYFELPQMLTYSNRCCEERMIKEVGFVIVSKEGDLYTYDGSALSKLPNLPEEYKTVKYYDKDFLVYVCSGDFENKESIHCYDMVTKKDFYIKEDFSSYNTFKDARIYFTTTEGEVGAYEGSVVYYNIRADLEKEIAHFEKMPGMPVYVEGAEGFCVAGGKFFYVGEDENDVRWYASDEFETNMTEYVLGTSSVAEFGHAECAKCLERCEFCDEIIYEYYEEFLVLDSSFSPYADDINEAMAGNALADMEDGEAYMGMRAANADDCEFYGHGQYYGCETSENRIVKVALFSDDKYLYVEKQGYWYGGGAHGYPLTSTELYDLTTGEQVDFLDVFPGTEEDLRKLIADKTVELYEYYEAQNEGYNPFEFEDDPKTVYEIAYDSAVAPYDIWFTEDGIIYYYPPYVMACYAQGYVEVPISFEELGLSDIFY